MKLLTLHLLAALAACETGSSVPSYDPEPIRGPRISGLDPLAPEVRDTILRFRAERARCTATPDCDEREPDPCLPPQPQTQMTSLQQSLLLEMEWMPQYYFDGQACYRPQVENPGPCFHERCYRWPTFDHCQTARRVCAELDR